MPRDIIIITTRDCPDPHQFIVSAAAINPDLLIRTIGGRAATQLYYEDGPVVLTISQPRHVRAPHETTRLLPRAMIDAPCFWIEAWTPWGPHGDLGTEIAQAFAASFHGTCMIEDPT